MKFTSLRVLAIITGIFASYSAIADDYFMGRPADSDSAACEEGSKECPRKWKANVEFGYVAVSGNSESTSTNGAFSASYEIKKWRHAGQIKSVVGSEDGVTKTEQYYGQFKTDYKITENNYGFGIVDYDKSRFSGFEYQSSVALGYGYRFLDSDTHVLDAEIGFGYRQSQIEQSTTVTAEKVTESMARLAASYSWKISDTAKFEQKLSTEIGEDNTISKSLSSLTANLNESLAMSVSYAIKHQSEVPVGSENRDTITSFTLVYNF